ncbi:MAG: hypothetical protein ACXV3S_05770 [Kineosporiaceae bacterium]
MVEVEVVGFDEVGEVVGLVVGDVGVDLVGAAVGVTVGEGWVGVEGDRVEPLQVTVTTVGFTVA